MTNDLEKKVLYNISKRTLDISGALVGLIILSIILLVVALLIKVEDPKGPIFFSQRRFGKDGKEFKMYKFRSMVTDAEAKLEELLKYNEVEGAMFKMKDDPRVTKIGRFIRKTSIDELPQLFNVLKGDMSLVGPRPPLPREVKEYTSYHMQRLLVTPGCTGVWQASARSSVGFEEMVEMDLYYIRNRSFWFDIKIIFKTVGVLFGSKNAF
ncbi:sugar transferase [Metabacillus rhizolycopersici]|uniref:Sugar transferase n=1 Tax=Metabacillus rhizolycopersici TaxID=2875709 RepID=A0ABS7UL61_9BACI|nr:exopolysaccharide biosynthesis polyprenyl glycosylphosphotransferase [Metabacillus rhizolycopersici]MBZ5749061.1 sugar transferase [Metabacillus rhizolycopersici]